MLVYWLFIIIIVPPWCFDAAMVTMAIIYHIGLRRRIKQGGGGDAGWRQIPEVVFAVKICLPPKEVWKGALFFEFRCILCFLISWTVFVLDGFPASFWIQMRKVVLLLKNYQNAHHMYVLYDGIQRNCSFCIWTLVVRRGVTDGATLSDLFYVRYA